MAEENNNMGGGENNNTDGGENNTNSGAETNGSAGPVIGLVVILAIIILGGLYFWGQRTDDGEALTDETTLTDEAVEAINLQSAADDTASIEADLDATDIESTDSEINAS